MLSVFWPTHIEQRTSGFLLGWRIESFVCVFDVVEAEDLSQVEESLKSLRKNLSDHCSRAVEGIDELDVVGQCYLNEQDSARPLRSPAASLDDIERVWIDVWWSDNRTALPCIRIPSLQNSSRITVTLFRPPNIRNFQCLSLEPLLLNIPTTTARLPHYQDGKKAGERSQLIDKVEEMMRSDPSSRIIGEGESCLQIILDKINAWAALQERAATYIPGLQGMLGRRPWSFTTLFSRARSGNGSQWASKLGRFREGPWLFRSLNMPLEVLAKFWSAPIFGTMGMKDISATVQQVDMRLEQIRFWHLQYALATRSPGKDLSVVDLGAQYISLYNGVWLVANDVIIGRALGTLLCENHELLARRLHEALETCTVQLVRETLFWLGNWPAGLKLNSELSMFLGDMFVGLTEIWAALLSQMSVYFPSLIYLLGCSGYLGSTMVLSLASDLLSLFTSHLYVFYLVATNMFSFFLRTMISLFNLFRGKKRNVLRNRVDSCDYELDQLLLGTILFTLTSFLFPTVLVYYAAFALSRVGIIMTHATLETVLAFMNHLPLFALMLRLKDPARLPGGLRFDWLAPPASDTGVDASENRPPQQTAYFHMRASKTAAPASEHTCQHALTT